METITAQLLFDSTTAVEIFILIVFASKNLEIF